MEAHPNPDRINDDSFALTLANNEMADDIEMPIELTDITGTNMLKLNDYCLLDIFSCDSLTPMDLCSLAETCKRFKQIVQGVFPKKFEIDSYDYEQLTVSKGYTRLRFEVTVDDCEQILRNFGSRLAHYVVREDAVMDLVAKYCDDGGALEHLTIKNDANVYKIAAKLKSIFERVKKLSIFSRNMLVGKSNEIIRCDSLVELKLESHYNLSFLRYNTFPNLRRFTTREDDYKQIDEVLFAFLCRHRLNYLRLRHVRGKCLSELVHKIDKRCKELKELEIDCYGLAVSADFSNLTNLTKLEILGIYSNIGSFDWIISLLRALKSLKTLRLRILPFEQHNPAQVLDILSQLPTLTKLVIKDTGKEFCAVDLQNIIKQLPILEELELGWRCRLMLSEEDFLAIVKIVQGRANVLTLTCRFNFVYAEKCYEKVKLMKILLN